MKPEFYQGPLENLFHDDVTLIDVRAPIEFADGAFPNAKNLPILSDEQRHLIGLCYKEKGQAAAIELGHQLVSGTDREQKIQAWLNEIKAHPEIYLYCFRGGSRSQISQSWIHERGQKIKIIEGGYKRLRTFLLDNIASQTAANSFLLISGNTGSGKTELLNRLSKEGHKTLDLEMMANHRGSAFGKELTPQPSQINFENALSIQFFKEERKKGKCILVEDEGKKIGRRVVPLIMQQRLLRSPIFVFEKSLEERVAFILEDYCIDRWKKFEQEDNAYELYFEFFKNAFDNLQRRFGGALHAECLQILKSSVDHQKMTGDFSRHQDWIKKVLVHYYDPNYEYGLNLRKDLIVERGDEKALRFYLNQTQH